MADSKEVILIDLSVKADDSVTKAITSIENLQKANKNMREERKKLDLQTDEGAAKLKAYNEAIDKNDKILKDNATTLEKQRLNIGNYASAIDKLIPGFDGLSQAVSGSGTFIKGATQSIGGMSTAMKVMLGPIGLVITAFGLVVAWLKGSEEGADLLSKRIDQLQAVMSVVADRAIMLGGALVKLFTGDLTGAAEDFGAATSGVVDEMKDAVKVAGELADILDLLEDRERAYNVAASSTTNEIKKLVIESKNRNLTEDQKADKLKKAYDLEVNQNKVIKKIREDALHVQLEQFNMDSKSAEGKRKLNETDAAYAKRILEVTKNAKGEMEVMNELGGAKDKVSEAVIALNEVEGESLNLQEKLTNKIDDLNVKQEAKKQKLIELAEKQDALTQKEADAIDKRLEREDTLHAKLDEGREKKETKDNEANAKESMGNMLLNNQKTINAENLRKLNEKLNREDLEDAIKTSQAVLSQASNLAQKITDAKIGALKVQENELNVALANEKTAINEVYSAELAALKAKNATIREEGLKLISESYQTELEALNKKLADGVLTQEKYDKELEKLKAKTDKKIVEMDKELAESEVALKQKRDADIKNAEIEQAKALNEIKRKEFEVNKKNSIIQATADAARAILGVIAATFGGPIIKGIAAAAIAAFAAIQINQIRNTEFVPTTFADGGKVGTFRGPSHAQGGINFQGSNGQRLNVEGDENFYILKKSASAEINRLSYLNESHGGRSFYVGRPSLPRFADGGLGASGGSQASAIDYAQLAQAMAAQKIVVFVEDINTGQGRVAQIESKGDLS